MQDKNQPKQPLLDKEKCGIYTMDYYLALKEILTFYNSVGITGWHYAKSNKPQT